MTVKRLVKSYFDITGKKAIDINKNFNFLFSVYRKQICIEIQRINREHTGGRKSSDCAVCKENFESPFFPYILLYCLLSCKPARISHRVIRLIAEQNLTRSILIITQRLSFEVVKKSVEKELNGMALNLMVSLNN